ncbi:hypothetical protein KAE70_06655 [Bartonella henselae]|uniref:Uncharacterized protein n=1 Tax=Bartonella henselae TaxID=38323 RepID=X5M652_BARHN|nr:hypothetical protein [Bartonella henselae]OLL52829.1 hypothetical protein AT239_03520 [Bartonella henselae]OLL55976.1 hypothetical protein AT240_06405 [Bartonella henselae]UJM32728.1 hypothetical protein KAE70_06655 [Bartonella henselae]UJM42980.1 hypothetical protein KAE73_06640 [Bartonella henselae]CDO46348.1 hypothetical protein BM1374165_00325 [Bartonella henselae]
MNTSIDFLCDLWIALFQFSNDENINEKECTALVDIMSLVEKVLILKLQDDVPNIVKILAVLTDFGDSELPHSMDSLLRAYEPDLDNPIKKVA